jgi:hypothetical protein
MKVDFDSLGELSASINLGDVEYIFHVDRSNGIWGPEVQEWRI